MCGGPRGGEGRGGRVKVCVCVCKSEGRYIRHCSLSSPPLPSIQAISHRTVYTLPSLSLFLPPLPPFVVPHHPPLTLPLTHYIFIRYYARRGIVVFLPNSSLLLCFGNVRMAWLFSRGCCVCVCVIVMIAVLLVSRYCSFILLHYSFYSLVIGGETGMLCCML